jgi:hypothetical protein
MLYIFVLNVNVSLYACTVVDVKIFFDESLYHNVCSSKIAVESQLSSDS